MACDFQIHVCGLTTTEPNNLVFQIRLIYSPNPILCRLFIFMVFGVALLSIEILTLSESSVVHEIAEHMEEHCVRTPHCAIMAQDSWVVPKARILFASALYPSPLSRFV